MQAAVPSAEASRYVFKNDSIQPFSPFHVKVGVYNNQGEGPFGAVTTIYSAEEGTRAKTQLPSGVHDLEDNFKVAVCVCVCVFGCRTRPGSHQGPGQEPLSIRGGGVVEGPSLEHKQETSAGLRGERR